MARPLRDTASGLFHVYTHSVWVGTLFKDESDRLAFLRELVRGGGKVGWTCLAFCLMTNHYHLILEVDDGALPLGMHAVNFNYATGFNRRYGLKGHAVGRRYGARRIVDDDDLKGRVRYVARNPVEAGLCRSPADWPWSSYAGTVGLAEPHSFVAGERIVRCFGEPRELAVAQLREFVEKS